MPLPAPTGGTLVSVAVSPPSAVVRFTGSAGVDHYDVYRSATSTGIGEKVNVAPVPQSASPFLFSFQDDGVASVSAPEVAQPYYYRAVAVDAGGNISLPSAAVPVTVQSSNQVMDRTLRRIREALAADGTLMGMLMGDVTRIRFHFQKPRMGFSFPFVVIWRMPTKEDKGMRPVRRLKTQYQFYIYDSSPSSQVGYNVRERIIQVLDGHPELLTDHSVRCFAVMALDQGQDLHEEQVNAWYYPMQLTIIAEIQAVAAGC